MRIYPLLLYVYAIIAAGKREFN